MCAEVVGVVSGSLRREEVLPKFHRFLPTPADNFTRLAEAIVWPSGLRFNVQVKAWNISKQRQYRHSS